MKSLIYKIIIFISIFFLFIFFIIKIISRLTTKCETLTLNSSKIEIKCNADGIIYKDEVVLNLGNEKIIKNIYKDGTKIDNDSTIAQIYKTKEDVLKYEEICDLEEELNDLKKINKEKLNKNIDLINLNKNIYLSYEKFLENTKRKNITDYMEEKRKLKNYINTKKILIENKSEISNVMSKIEKQIVSIKNSINMPTNIVSENAGYFVGKTDDFEEKCSIESVSNFKLKEYKEFIKKIDNKKQINNKNIKIITSPTILYKAIVPVKDIVKKKVGDRCKINFKEIGEKIPAYINDMIFNYNEKEGIVVFEIFDMTEKLSTLRKSSSEIIFKKINGFKIPKEALKVNENNETGVYVFEVDKMKFKKINIIFEDKDFFICSDKPKENDKTNNFVKNLDRIILKGMNLYNNKKT